MHKNKKSILETHPEIAKQWHPTKNKGLKIEDFSRGNHTKVWWKCDVAEDHEWPSEISSRVYLHTNCPCCANLKVCLSNCLATTHPEIAKQWHKTKNGNLTPFDVVAGSNKKFWWQCYISPDHEWETSISKRTYEDQHCSCCDGKKVVLSNCLATTHPEIAKQWHPTKNKHLTPFNFVAGSTKKVWWKCPIADDHEWETDILTRSRMRKNAKSGCPCCTGQKVVLSNCLATTHPEIAKQWHPTKNGKLTPYDVVGGSEKKVWWKCDKYNHNSWYTSAYSLVINGSGCPTCKKSHGEKKIDSFLIIKNINFITQKKFDGCKNIRKLSFDFYLPDYNICIEYDGELHFVSSRFRGGEKKFESTQRNDKIKNEYCKNNNIPLLRIPYWDFKNIETILTKELKLSPS